PPGLAKLYRSLRKETEPSYGWFGDYATWQQALAHAQGYDSESILNKVKAAAIAVKRGEAVFERDSVLFREEDYNWPLCAILLRIADGNRLALVDFGGALGSSYFQNRHFLSDRLTISWNIVEQHHFVECGIKELQSDQLHFYHSIEECPRDARKGTL